MRRDMIIISYNQSQGYMEVTIMNLDFKRNMHRAMVAIVTSIDIRFDAWPEEVLKNSRVRDSYLRAIGAVYGYEETERALQKLEKCF